MILERIEFLRRVFRPKRVVGHSKIRIGRQADGGYVHLDAFDTVFGAISAGIGDEVSWDAGVVKLLNVSVDQYDHTIDFAPIGHPRLTWRRAGVGPAPGMFTLAEAVALKDSVLGEPRGDYLLKMDIEGGEWAALIDCPVLGRFSQIVVELHDLLTIDVGKIERLAASLNEQHELIHIHGNNCGVCATDAIGDVPETLECTWVRRDGYAFVAETDLFPIAGLDFPNNPLAEDYQLRWLA